MTVVMVRGDRGHGFAALSRDVSLSQPGPRISRVWGMNEFAPTAPQSPSTQPAGPAAGASRGPGPLLHLAILLGPFVALMLANLLIGGAIQVLLPDEPDAPAWILTAIVVAQSVAVCGLVVVFCILLLRVQGLRLRDAGLRWTSASLLSLFAVSASGRWSCSASDCP